MAKIRTDVVFSYTKFTKIFIKRGESKLQIEEKNIKVQS